MYEIALSNLETKSANGCVRRTKMSMRVLYSAVVKRRKDKEVATMCIVPPVPFVEGNFLVLWGVT